MHLLNYNPWNKYCSLPIAISITAEAYYLLNIYTSGKLIRIAPNYGKYVPNSCLPLIIPLNGTQGSSKTPNFQQYLRGHNLHFSRKSEKGPKNRTLRNRRFVPTVAIIRTNLILRIHTWARLPNNTCPEHCCEMFAVKDTFDEDTRTYLWIDCTKYRSICERCGAFCFIRHLIKIETCYGNGETRCFLSCV